MPRTPSIPRPSFDELLAAGCVPPAIRCIDGACPLKAEVTGVVVAMNEDGYTVTTTYACPSGHPYGRVMTF